MPADMLIADSQPVGLRLTPLPVSPSFFAISPPLLTPLSAASSFRRYFDEYSLRSLFRPTLHILPSRHYCHCCHTTLRLSPPLFFIITAIGLRFIALPFSYSDYVIFAASLFFTPFADHYCLALLSLMPPCRRLTAAAAGCRHAAAAASRRGQVAPPFLPAVFWRRGCRLAPLPPA